MSGIVFRGRKRWDANAYYFYPRTFEGINEVGLSWSINGDFIEVTSGSDVSFYHQFRPGNYEVCLFVETPTCPSGMSYCTTMVVD